VAEPYILAIDQGTTSSRALVVDVRGRIRGLGQHGFAQHYPHPGWVEHDPWDLWESTASAIADALRAASVRPRELAAVGITNQRETVVAWERATGNPVAPAIVWQDRRTADVCETLRDEGFEPRIANATGLTLDPYFSGTKLWWLFDRHAGLRERAERGEIAVGTVDSWLTWNLTAGACHVTDYTNASRTLLFNIRRGRWDRDLTDLLGVPMGVLPEVVPSSGLIGYTDPEVLSARVPITGIAGDQQAALFGQWCVDPGVAKNTYGTGCFLLAPAGRRARPSANHLLLTLSATSGAKGPEYAYEGSVFVAGAAVQWLRDELGIIERSDEIEGLARSVGDTGGVVFVPAFTGLGAPDWDPHARGMMIGLTRGTTRAHIARAALEAIAASSADLLTAMNADLGGPVLELRVDGGACRNDLLMQLQADYCGIPVLRPRQTETTALGAAYLAGLGAGVWDGLEAVRSLWELERVFEPSIGDDERDERLATWRRAVARASGWALER